MEKPKIKTISTVDFISAQNWLVETGKVTSEQSDKAWDWMCDHLCVQNDSAYLNPYPIETYEGCKYDVDVLEFSRIFVEEFPDVNQLYVSW